MRSLARFFKPFITRWPSRWFQLAAMLIVAQSCGQSDSSSLLGPAVSPLDSAIVQLTPQQVTLASGDSNQFVAVEIEPNSGEVAADVVWTATGGTITSAGLFIAGATPGTYQVTAQIRGHSPFGTAPVVVAMPLLTSLSLSPATVTLLAGATQQFAPRGTWSNGSTTAPAVTYSVTGGTITASGSYTAGSAPGTFKVIATQTGGTKADTSIVTIGVPAAMLVQMVLSPAAMTLAPGAIGLFTATGTWSDGSVTAPAVSYAATGGTITAGGVYTAGTTPGVYRVIAAQQGGGKADTSAVTISAVAPTLSKLTISPKTVSLSASGVQQFTVSGALSDGSVTVPVVTYSATGGTIAASGAYVAGTTAGTFAVVATQQGGTKADTAQVTVAMAPPTLTQMALSPASVSLAAGGTQQFAVSGTWSNGSTAPPAVVYSATGGTITSGGLFTAGSSAGTFHVVVQQAGGSLADTTIVVVRPIGEPLVILGDRTPYTQGQYGAYASPWSTLVDSTLRAGIDYSDSIIVNPGNFTDSTDIRWHWPDRASTTTGVWGYMSIWFGNYDGGATAVQVTPRQVKNISTLQQVFALSRSNTGSFNILNEFYLTSQAGNSAAKVIEIGYFLHPSAAANAFFAAGQTVGSYQDASGRTWDVRMQGTFCMLIPSDGEDVLSGSIDVKAMLAFLTTKGVITGNEWFNGIALGVEPVSGSGDLEVAQWAVTYR